MQVVTPVSLLGLPCLAVPVGFGDTDVSTGLPMGLQIFAPQGHDRRLLALGQNYHQATQWPQKSPPPLR